MGLPWIILYIYIHFLSKEVSKSNFRQYGQMEKQRCEESRRRRKEVRRSEKRKREKKEDAGARKGRKVAIHCVFPMICDSGGSESRLAKAAGAEPAGQMRDEELHAVVARSTFPSHNVQNTQFSDHFWKFRCRKIAHSCGAKHISKSQCTKHTILRPLLEAQMSKKCTPLWREAHFHVIMYKTHHSQTIFGSSDVEKLHTVVARSTFPTENLQTTPTSDHFWKLRCRKSARCCGAKHISKSQCTKHTILRPLLEVQMSKKCTPLWRKAHFQVTMYKTHNSQTTFGSSDVEKVHAVVARSTFPSQNAQKHLSSEALLDVEMSKKCTPLWHEAHVQRKIYKPHQRRTTFGSSDVERVHAVVARSTFPSQQCEKLTGPDHFLTFRCRFAWQAQGIVYLVKK